MAFCHKTKASIFGQKLERREQKQLKQECFAKHRFYLSHLSVHISYGFALKTKRTWQTMTNMLQHLRLQFLTQKWPQCCVTTCSFDQLKGCSLWTHNMAKCSEKHSQVSKKLGKLSISWSTSQQHFMLLQILTTNVFSKRCLKSIILHLATFEPSQTTKSHQFQEPTILYGQRQLFQLYQPLWQWTTSNVH